MNHRSFFVSLILFAACSDTDAPPMATPDAGPPPPPSLRLGADVAFVPVYDAVSYQEGSETRDWLPVDVAAHPAGELWVVQRMTRDPAFDDESECTQRGLEGGPNDCVSLQGSTVALSDPAATEPATRANGRANLVVDQNAWHFMRRPSSIAFGAGELRVEPGSPGADGTLITESVVYTNTFATCHEHLTANPTDQSPFIGPTLWTSDPAIYNGENGRFDWSNGSHLDMVHATQYCMGIAYEGGNTYWTFNGAAGTLDRYDFGSPHFTGHYDHDDGEVTRMILGEEESVVRVPYVPSNLEMLGTDLYVADTGNGRILRIDTSSVPTDTGAFDTFEGLPATFARGMAWDVVADAALLSAQWAGASEPSGLAFLDEQTLVVANHATGHITLLELDGTPIRTIDTGRGAGLGGLTAIDGTLYFVQMNERRVYRVDLLQPAE